MYTILVVSSLFVLTQGPTAFQNRERHPLAPSLPRLTKAEEQKFEGIIDRMILADIGKLKGAGAKKALDDFKTLGPEATFHLIDGLNRTANMESSCPAVIIAKKLSAIVLSTNDLQLLAFAKENIGAGVVAKRHLNVMHDLQTRILLRKGTLQRQALAAKTGNNPGKPLSNMTLAELEQAAKQNGPQLKSILLEAEKRQGMKAIDVLQMGIAHQNSDIVKFSQGLLAKNLTRQSADTLKALLRHNERDIRIAAVDAIGAKKLRFGTELIDLLQDGDADVRQASRRALVQIAGVDHGPGPNANVDEREAAITRWRAWWSMQK
jgi:hypothetical protein